jgi:hypothetical protein
MAKMTVDNVIDRVLQKIQDDGIDSDFILEAFNQCNVHLATVVDIKELATVSEVIFLAGVNEIPLPDDFHKNFTMGYNDSVDCKLAVFESRRVLDYRTRGLSNSGNVIAVCNDSPNIYYKCSPSVDQNGRIYYHRLPIDLAEGGSFPPYIPNGSVYRLFFHYTVSQCYDFIEDGIDGGPEDKKTNTIYHDSKFKEALKEFISFVGPDPNNAYDSRSNQKFDFDCFE